MLSTNSRSQFKKTASNELIIDAYNANPTSMGAALENFKNMVAPNKVVILGDMKELGHVSEVEHQKIADMLPALHLKQAFLIGTEFAKTNSDALKFDSVDLLNEYLSKNPISSSLILVKGSNSMKLTSCVDNL